MNINASRLGWIVGAIAVPVAGYFVYRSLSPEQKKKFKRSLFDGTISLAGTAISALVEQYRKEMRPSPAAVAVGDRFVRMARIPNPDETETTIGDERW